MLDWTAGFLPPTQDICPSIHSPIHLFIHQSTHPSIYPDRQTVVKHTDLTAHLTDGRPEENQQRLVQGTEGQCTVISSWFTLILALPEAL